MQDLWAITRFSATASIKSNLFLLLLKTGDMWWNKSRLLKACPSWAFATLQKSERMLFLFDIIFQFLFIPLEKKKKSMWKDIKRRITSCCCWAWVWANDKQTVCNQKPFRHSCLFIPHLFSDWQKIRKTENKTTTTKQKKKAFIIIFFLFLSKCLSLVLAWSIKVFVSFLWSQTWTKILSIQLEYKFSGLCQIF